MSKRCDKIQMASIYLCQIQLGPLKLLPPYWLSPLLALYILHTDFSQHWLLFHAPHLTYLMSFLLLLLRNKKKIPNHIRPSVSTTVCSYFLETHYLLALSVELTENLLETSNSRAPVFIKSLLTTEYHILTLLVLLEH